MHPEALAKADRAVAAAGYEGGPAFAKASARQAEELFRSRKTLYFPSPQEFTPKLELGPIAP